MVKGILFFLWLASSWAALAADRAAAQTLPDGCPDIQGTYYCDYWSIHHREQGGHFQRFERIPDPEPPGNTTIYRVFKYKSPDEAKKKGGSILVADGEKKWRGKDHSIAKCEEGTLSLYIEQDIYKVRASWYFKDDILVKKFHKTYRYFGEGGILKQTYPCKKVEGNPEAASACNNHWCSWSMDQEKADCYKRLCNPLPEGEGYEGCFNKRCANDWSKPTARSTVNLVNQQLPQLAMGLTSPTTCAGQ